MLQWTAAGAVAAPDTVQIRVTRQFSGRVPAGAPDPTRSLSDEEIRSNLYAFTVGRRGPRTKPCRAVVLSGLDVSARPDMAALLAESRGWGIERITLHLGHGEREILAASPLRKVVDVVVVTVAGTPDLADVAALRRAPGGPHVNVVVLLDEATLPQLPALVAGLAALKPSRVVLTWPLPSGGELPPHADRVALALHAVVPTLDAAEVPVHIKGMPACRLGSLASRVTRSGNRWYIDADHQNDRALLFFPDVVRFLRVDECRFCVAADHCDGPPEMWWRRGLCGVIRAIEAS